MSKSKWSDRKTVVVASSIFFASIVGSFVVAITWNVVFSVLCVLGGLGAALILLTNATDEPNHNHND